VNQLIIFVAQYAVALLPLLLVTIFVRLPKDKRLSLTVTLALGGALSLIGILIASHLFYDPRPFMSGNVAALFPHAAGNGFPSDHMTLGATLAFIGYAYSKKIGFVMIALAVAIGAARVLAHVHSWIDIFGGIVIALLSVLLAVYVSRCVTDKWLSRPHILKTR
jgi:undecaprenyl-diphosphatase